MVFVTDPAQLNILASQKASYGDLNFSFSEKYLNWLKSQLKNKHAYQVILEEDDQFVGYLASAETLWNDKLTIVEVFVSPNFQGRGIGKKLLSFAVEFAKKNGLQGLVVQTEHENTPAQKLYEKFGFAKLENKEWEGITYSLAL